MTWPTVAVVTTNLDAAADSPASARSDLLDAVQKLNQQIAHVSTFMATVLDDVSDTAARATLVAAKSGANTDITSLSAPALGAATATTAAAADNDTSVATTAFVQQELTSQAVKLTGAQTVAGVKTFSSAATFGSASMPTPSGTASLYACRAWCVFNGTTAGTNAPLAGGNVSTVTRNSAGDYTINLTTALTDANYSIVGSCKTSNVYVNGASVAKSASNPRIGTSTGSGGGAFDDDSVSVAIFR